MLFPFLFLLPTIAKLKIPKKLHNKCVLLAKTNPPPPPLDW